MLAPQKHQRLHHEASRGGGDVRANRKDGQSLSSHFKEAGSGEKHMHAYALRDPLSSGADCHVLSFILSNKECFLDPLNSSSHIAIH